MLNYTHALVRLKSSHCQFCYNDLVDISRVNMRSLTLLSFLIPVLTTDFVSDVFSNELSVKEEIEQVMEFDQACIIMHEVGSRYLEDEEKIIKSHEASKLIEEHLESKLVEYSVLTGDDIDEVRDSVFGNGVIIFNDLSKHQPRDLVYQCRDLLKKIKKTDLKFQAT